MKRCLVLLLVLFFGLFGCAGVQVSQDYEPGTNFSTLKTYAWQQRPIDYGKDPRENNQLLHKRFFEAINSALGEKGFARSEKADFRVTYNFSITTKIDSYPSSGHYGFGIGSHRRYGGYGGIGYNYGSDIRQYDIGILVIDIYDGVTDTLIWRGKGSETIANHSTPQQTTDMVGRMVWKILTQFPPGSS